MILNLFMMLHLFTRIGECATSEGRLQQAYNHVSIQDTKDGAALPQAQALPMKDPMRDLEEMEVHKQWWFWLIIGVVTVTVIAIIIYCCCC